MKKALLSVRTGLEINIGDYIQALASSQFLDNVDFFIEREELSDYNGDEVFLIMNGWFMHHPEKWPPSPKINPFFIAFHLNNSVDNKLLNNESILYLKKYEPIGCRDKETVRKLEKYGVKAYFSGCMTLTLGYKYRSEVRDGKVYFVDPIVTFRNNYDKLVYLLLSFFKFKDIYKIYKKTYKDIKRFKLGYWCYTSKFIYKYSKLFDYNMLLNAEYRIHSDPCYHELKTANELMEKAEEMVKDYAKASCVITSRIHCALPCLGLETPVLYVNNNIQHNYSSCRLDGLIQLFNVINWDGNSLNTYLEIKGNKINKNNFPLNKEDWKEYANNLIKKCLDIHIK